MMEERIYVVESLDGDYAYLKRITPPDEGNEPTLVARALLPEEIEEGTKVKRILFDYEIYE